MVKARRELEQYIIRYNGAWKHSSLEKQNTGCRILPGEMKRLMKQPESNRKPGQAVHQSVATSAP